MISIAIGLLMFCVGIALMYIKKVIIAEAALSLMLLMIIFDGIIIYGFYDANVANIKIALGILMGTVFKIFGFLLYERISENG